MFNEAILVLSTIYTPSHPDDNEVPVQDNKLLKMTNKFTKTWNVQKAKDSPVSDQ
jgi:hypothetical protein